MKNIIIILCLLLSTMSSAQKKIDFNEQLDSSLYNMRTNNFIKSFLIVENLKQHKDKIQDSSILARLYNYDGFMKMNSNNLDEAKSLFLSSIQLYEKAGDHIRANCVITNLAYNEFKSKNFDSSKLYYEQSIKVLKKEERHYVFIGYLGYAQSLFLKGHNHDVIKVCEEALSLYKTFNFNKKHAVKKEDIDNWIIPGIKAVKAYAMLESNTKIDEAYALIANLKTKKLPNQIWEDYSTNDIIETYKTLYFYKKNNKDSLQYYINRNHSNIITLNKSNIYKDHVSNSNNINTIKKEFQLKKELEEKKMVRKASNYIVIIVSLLLTLVVIYAYFRKKILKQEQLLNKKLSIQNKTLQNILESKSELEIRLNYIKDNIVNDFNDNFGNRISSISSSIENLNHLMSFNKLQGEEFSLFLKHLNQQLTNLNEDLKDLSWTMSSDSTILSKNVQQINKHIDYCSKKYDVIVNTNINLEKEVDIPLFWSKQIIDIYKEAINNSIVHSKSKKIEISILLDSQNNFTFICKDYGIGINMSCFKEKKGMANLKRKVKSINFNIATSTKLGKETQIKVFGEIPKTNYNLEAVLI